MHARTPALSRTAYLLTGDAHLAEDLVQTALFKAAKAWHRIDGDPEPYVRRILYTQNVSWWRRAGSPETVPRLVRRPGGVHRDSDLRLTLEQALARLTTRQRTVLVLRYFEDLTEVQTAAALGIGSGTVKSITRQALARLRTLAPELAELIGETLMTTDELRRELDRIADSAPASPTSPTTPGPAPGVRSSATASRSSPQLPPWSSASPASWPGFPTVQSRRWRPVPRGAHRIQDAPTYFTGQDLDDLTYSGDIETDLAVGRGAVAYATEEGVPVLVDAATGAYHFLALPGFTGIDAAMELSPDGQRLAYSYADPRCPGAELGPDADRCCGSSTSRRGTSDDVPLQGGMGVAVDDVSWSPSGTWLIWRLEDERLGQRPVRLVRAFPPWRRGTRSRCLAGGRPRPSAVHRGGRVRPRGGHPRQPQLDRIQGLGEPVVHAVAKPGQGLNLVVFASFTDVGVAVITANPSGYGYRIREDFADGYAPNLGYGRAVGLRLRHWTRSADGSWTPSRATGPEVEDNGSTPASSDEDLVELSQLAILDVESSDLTPPTRRTVVSRP